MSEAIQSRRAAEEIGRNRVNKFVANGGSGKINNKQFSELKSPRRTAKLIRKVKLCLWKKWKKIVWRPLA